MKTSQSFKLAVVSFVISVSLLFTLSGYQDSFSQWLPQNINNDTGLFRGIKFLNSNEGYVGGWKLENSLSKAILYKTQNGGQSWDRVIVPDSARVIAGITFLDQNAIFLAGAHSKLVQNSITSFNINEFSYMPGKINPLMFGSISPAENSQYRGMILRSTDAGESWENVYDEDYYDYMLQIEFLNANTGITTGVYSAPIAESDISITTNGGADWTRLHIPYLFVLLYGIQFKQDGVIFGAGSIRQKDGEDKGIIISSSDMGKTWNRKILPELTYFTGIKFINNDVGFATGNRLNEFLIPCTDVYKTTNGGIDWLPMNLGLDSIHLVGINFSKDNTRGMIYGHTLVGNQPPWYGVDKIITGITTDKGNSWNLERFEFDKVALDCSFADSLNIFMCGSKSDYTFHPYLIKSTNGGVSSVSYLGNSEIPNTFELYQNYPNPFNPETKIKFSITTGHHNVKLSVYDILGKEIKLLVNDNLAAGSYEYKFDASTLPSGLYFYKLEAGNFSMTKKMTLIK